MSGMVPGICGFQYDMVLADGASLDDMVFAVAEDPWLLALGDANIGCRPEPVVLAPFPDGLDCFSFNLASVSLNLASSASSSWLCEDTACFLERISIASAA